jgi:hypothetical protein
MVRLWLKFPGGRKRLILAVLKVFAFLLLVPLAVWFWPQTLEILKRQRQRKFYDHEYGRKRNRRFPLNPNKDKARMRRLWDEYFEIQKQRFYQRQEELREEFSAQIEQMRNQTKRKDQV